MGSLPSSMYHVTASCKRPITDEKKLESIAFNWKEHLSKFLNSFEGDLNLNYKINLFLKMRFLIDLTMFLFQF